MEHKEDVRKILKKLGLAFTDVDEFMEKIEKGEKSTKEKTSETK